LITLSELPDLPPSSTAAKSVGTGAIEAATPVTAANVRKPRRETDSLLITLPSFFVIFNLLPSQIMKSEEEIRK
jgi:hypothetical protein